MTMLSPLTPLPPPPSPSPFPKLQSPNLNVDGEQLSGDRNSSVLTCEKNDGPTTSRSDQLETVTRINFVFKSGRKNRCNNHQKADNSDKNAAAKGDDERIQNLAAGSKHREERVETLEEKDEVTALEDGGNKSNVEKKNRKISFSTFSVSLTTEEIDADLSAMGVRGRSKPRTTRKAKKRTRTRSVQENLDDLFPGLRLKFITPDDYRVRNP